MYLPTLFNPVRPFEPATRENNPLDLSVKPVRTAEDELMMLDHRKLAYPLGRQLLDPYNRLGYDAAAAAAFCANPIMTGLYRTPQLAYVDPLQLRNSISQREAAAALAVSRGLYVPALQPMMLPAFPIYSAQDEKTALLQRGGVDAVRYAEQLQRMHQGTKCVGSCCCCVQSPSQSALCARSPLECTTKDPTVAASVKMGDFPTFLHRPTATSAATVTTSVASSSDIKLSISNLCSTQTTSEHATVNSSVDKQPPTVFRPPNIWNAGLPSSENKTAFSVPKKKDNASKEIAFYHSKERRSSGSIKDILKDSGSVSDISRYEKSNTMQHKIETVHSSNDKYSAQMSDLDPMRYMKKENSDHSSFSFSKTTVPISVNPNYSNVTLNGKEGGVINSTNSIITSRNEAGSTPITKMPPFLEINRTSESHPSVERGLSLLNSQQGPPPLIAASTVADHSTVIRSPYLASQNSSAPRLPPAVYANSSVTASPYKHQPDKSNIEIQSAKTSSSKSHKKVNHSTSGKFNGVANNGEPVPMSSFPTKPLPSKPVPQIPSVHHLAANANQYANHYRPAQHQLNLQAQNDWIPRASPNVTVASIPQPSSTSTSVQGPSKQAVTTSSSLSQREAEAANVLQSLLSRSKPGLEQYSTLPVSSSSVICSPQSLPMFNLDYRYHMTPHLNLVNNGSLNISSPLIMNQNMATKSALDSPKSKFEPIKSEPPAPYSSSSLLKHKKRPSSDVGNQETNTKKRILSTDFSSPMPRYSFQTSTYTSEALEPPDSPYTFVPEPPLNFSGQVKREDYRPLWREKKSHELISHDVQRSPVLVPSKSPAKPTESPCSRQDRLVAIRAKRRLRKRLLARIYQQRKPLLNRVQVPLDREAIDRQLTVRYAKKLLSQLTLRWAHRRYMHKWYAIRRKSVNSVIKLKKKKKDGKVIYKLNKDGSSEQPGTSKDGLLSEDIPKGKDSIPMPPEMKKLIPNKALGETQLHHAARRGCTEAVAYCLRTQCVSVNARDNAGYTPLHECCSRGHLEIARALLQYGADVNASAAGGIRPLHDAIENDHVEIVRLLLSYGSDPTIATYSGLEPIKLARSPMMAEFLQGFFADMSGEVDCKPHLPWRFWGSSSCLDPKDMGYDVLSGVPTDSESEGEEDNDFLFEVSDSPHLPTFRLLHPANSHCNYLRLSDVLRKLNMSRDDFLQRYAHIEPLATARHEFEASATCSPLLDGGGSSASGPQDAASTELVRLDNIIRKVLGIETISVR